MSAPLSKVCSSLEICLASLGSGASLAAPSQARTVVGAYARGLGELLLHPDPPSRHTKVGSFQDHRGAAVANAVDVQAVIANVHHLAGWRIGSLGKLCSDCLVNCSNDGENQESNDQPQERLPGPPQDPSGCAAHYTSRLLPSEVLCFCRRLIHRVA